MSEEALDSWLGLMVPSRTKSGDPLTGAFIKESLRYAREAFVDIFKALTDEGALNVFEKSELHGVYTTRTGVCITEQVVLLYAYYPSSRRREFQAKVIELASRLRDRMDQECIAVVESTESTMTFV